MKVEWGSNFLTSPATEKKKNSLAIPKSKKNAIYGSCENKWRDLLNLRAYLRVAILELTRAGTRAWCLVELGKVKRLQCPSFLGFVRNPKGTQKGKKKFNCGWSKSLMCLTYWHWNLRRQKEKVPHAFSFRVTRPKGKKCIYYILNPTTSTQFLCHSHLTSTRFHVNYDLSKKVTTGHHP